MVFKKDPIDVQLDDIMNTEKKETPENGNIYEDETLNEIMADEIETGTQFIHPKEMFGNDVKTTISINFGIGPQSRERIRMFGTERQVQKNSNDPNRIEYFNSLKPSNCNEEVCIAALNCHIPLAQILHTIKKNRGDIPESKLLVEKSETSLHSEVEISDALSTKQEPATDNRDEFVLKPPVSSGEVPPLSRSGSRNSRRKGSGDGFRMKLQPSSSDPGGKQVDPVDIPRPRPPSR